ncbi:MAG: CDP-alcohol phosphatidyltransferase family protein [Thermodesulfobacteriota bacterium]
MDHAIVVAAGTGIEDTDLNRYGSIEFGSLPQIKRLVITAQRAGIEHFTIITQDSDSILKDLLSNDKRIESTINWITLDEEIHFDSVPYLILQSNLLTTPDALSSFMESELKKTEISILADTSDDLWVKANGDKVEEITPNGGRIVGAYIAGGNLLNKSFSKTKSIKNLVSEIVESGKAKYGKFSGKYWMRLNEDEDTGKEAEDLIFNYVGKTATGWISRNINSKFSLPTSRQLVKTPLSPNMISIGINIIGSLCGVFYALGHPVIGALFMHIATILDRCDGEVARVKLMETKEGEWVDTISDQFTVLSFLIGAPLGYYLVSGSSLALIMGGITLFIFAFFLIWSFYFLTRYTTSGSLVAYFKVDSLVEDQNTSILRKVIKIVRPMGRRNVYSIAMLGIAIVGGYPWVVGITTLAAIMFFLHQIEDIIKLRRVKPEKQIEY